MGIAAGREFDPEELRRGDTVAVLGMTVADKLFGETDPIGHTVRIGTTPYRVIGIAATKGGDRDDVVFCRSMRGGAGPSAGTPPETVRSWRFS